MNSSESSKGSCYDDDSFEDGSLEASIKLLEEQLTSDPDADEDSMDEEEMKTSSQPKKAKNKTIAERQELKQRHTFEQQRLQLKQIQHPSQNTKCLDFKQQECELQPKSVKQIKQTPPPPSAPSGPSKQMQQKYELRQQSTFKKESRTDVFRNFNTKELYFNEFLGYEEYKKKLFEMDQEKLMNTLQESIESDGKAIINKMVGFDDEDNGDNTSNNTSNNNNNSSNTINNNGDYENDNSDNVNDTDTTEYDADGNKIHKDKFNKNYKNNNQRDDPNKKTNSNDNHTNTDGSRPSSLNSDEQRDFQTNMNKKMSFLDRERNRNSSRRSLSFTNERMREIERHNQILLQRIVAKRPTNSQSLSRRSTFAGSMSNGQAGGSFAVLGSTEPIIAKRQLHSIVASSKINRKRQQRQIDLDNQVLKRKLEQISSKKTNKFSVQQK